MCTDLTEFSAVLYGTAGVGIVKKCVDFLVLVVLYGTVLQEKELLHVCSVLTAFGVVRYSTAGLSIIKLCVQFLQLVLLYGTVLKA